MAVETVGIIGAGKLGTVLAQLARKAGYTVLVSGSGDPAHIRLSVTVLAPGAEAVATADLVRRADVVILALPLNRFRELPKKELVGKLVIDAMNYWWESDGPRSSVLPDAVSSSEAVQEFLVGARVVKALSHMSYHDLHDTPQPAGVVGRRAIAIAGNEMRDVQTVSSIVDRFGFDTVYLGGLGEGRRLEPGSPVFGGSYTADVLRRRLAE